MDLLKAELERKRKAKAEEFGGQKYVKKAHITAVREAKLRKEEEEERRAKRDATANRSAPPAGTSSEGDADAAAEKSGAAAATTTSKKGDAPAGGETAEVRAAFSRLDVARPTRSFARPPTLTNAPPPPRAPRDRSLPPSLPRPRDRPPPTRPASATTTSRTWSSSTSRRRFDASERSGSRRRCSASPSSIVFDACTSCSEPSWWRTSTRAGSRRTRSRRS